MVKGFDAGAKVYENLDERITSAFILYCYGNKESLHLASRQTLQARYQIKMTDIYFIV